MRSSWSITILIAAVAVGGYAAWSRPVLAQADPLPYAVGDRVIFTHPGGGSQRCQIEEIRGLFVRCGPLAQGRASWTNASAMLAVDVTVPK